MLAKSKSWYVGDHTRVKTVNPQKKRQKKLELFKKSIFIDELDLKYSRNREEIKKKVYQFPSELKWEKQIKWKKMVKYFYWTASLQGYWYWIGQILETFLLRLFGVPPSVVQNLTKH